MASCMGKRLNVCWAAPLCPCRACGGVCRFINRQAGTSDRKCDAVEKFAYDRWPWAGWRPDDFDIRRRLHPRTSMARQAQPAAGRCLQASVAGTCANDATGGGGQSARLLKHRTHDVLAGAGQESIRGRDAASSLAVTGPATLVPRCYTSKAVVSYPMYSRRGAALYGRPGDPELARPEARNVQPPLPPAEPTTPTDVAVLATLTVGRRKRPPTPCRRSAWVALRRAPPAS